LLLDTPTIGCAKSLLIGTHGPLPVAAGAWTPLRDGDEVIGAVLRTRPAVNPIYVTQGHRVSLPTALKFVLAVLDGYRIPRPTRDADHFVAAIKRGEYKNRRCSRRP
jgi:deoxyribonuclease V